MTRVFGEIDFDVILIGMIQNLPGSLSMWPALLNASESFPNLEKSNTA